MFGWIGRAWRRRRLRPVVTALPRLLRHRYGASEFYTAGQVQHAARALGLKGKRLLHAFAMACDLEEFRKAVPAEGATTYTTIRKELAQLFSIEEQRLNCRDLTSTSFSSVGEENSLLDRMYALNSLARGD